MRKRLIFTLLFEDGYFVLSRNFRTQRIGDVDWLHQNYDFSRVAFFIDELIILNVSSDGQNRDAFCDVVKKVSRGCFAPISAGGGIRSVEDAKQLFNSGADKIVLNKALYDDPQLVQDITAKWGRQATVGSLDAKRVGDAFSFFSDKGKVQQRASAVERVVREKAVGEIYLTSIEKDGTGQGLDLPLADFFQTLSQSKLPVIIAGGAGKPDHLISALEHPSIGAVATANLLNFVGDGLERARALTCESGIDLATWDSPARLAGPSP